MHPLPETPLIAVVGPTGTGKTELAEHLARLFDGELINADSRQFYRGLDIGTAKPPGKLQPDGSFLADSGAVYRLIDIREPDEPMNLAQFQALAREAWSDIASRRRLPILVGGTGLYVEATITDLELPSPGSSPEKRPFPRLPIPENVLLIAPRRTDKELRVRLIARMDEIFSSGVVAEAKKAFEIYPPNLPALSGIIYPILKRHLDGEVTLEETKKEFLAGDWQLARRQRTWWRRRPEVQLVKDFQEAEALTQSFLSSQAPLRGE
jgi:tRNA A37 N6-isopentenylltransferase MiaA